MAWGGFFDPRYAGDFQFAVALEFAIQAVCQFKKFHRGLLETIRGSAFGEMPSNHSTTNFWGMVGSGMASDWRGLNAHPLQTPQRIGRRRTEYRKKLRPRNRRKSNHEINPSG